MRIVVGIFFFVCKMEILQLKEDQGKRAHWSISHSFVHTNQNSLHLNNETQTPK